MSDPNPQDIVNALAGKKAGPPPINGVGSYVGHLGSEYWKELQRWLPFLGMAIPSPSGSLIATQAARAARDPGPAAMPHYWFNPMSEHQLAVTRNATNPFPVAPGQTPGPGSPYPALNSNIPPQP